MATILVGKSSLSIPGSPVTGAPSVPVPTSAAALAAWFMANRRDLPWRSELPRIPLGASGEQGSSVEESEPEPRRDPYRTWISEIMLQQTQVSTVVDYFKRWMARFPDVASLAAAREEEVLEAWAGLGYYSRARNLLVTAGQVMGDHGGRFPWKREELLALKGVGEYTAGAIASLAFNRPEPILDGNLVRVFSRLYGMDFLPDTRAGKDAYWRWSTVWVESHEPGLVNEGLMELGATVCLPKNPLCGSCPLASGCHAFAAGAQDRFPPAKPRKEAKDINGFAVVARKGTDAREVLLYRPRKPELLTGLLTFPVVAVADLPSLKAAWGRLLPDAGPTAFRPRAVTVTHSITHHRIRLRLVEATMEGMDPAIPLPEGFLWAPAAEMDRLLVSSLPRKIWKAI